MQIYQTLPEYTTLRWYKCSQGKTGLLVGMVLFVDVARWSQAED